MSIIDPVTGRPFAAKLTNEQIAKMLDVLRNNQKFLNDQTIAVASQVNKIGLLLEYVIDRLHDTPEGSEKPLIGLKLDEFPGWAEAQMKRMEEIAREEMAKEAGIKMQSDDDTAEAPVYSGIVLDA